ncbi:class II aldolase/adducin family protein [Amycolatopsis jiangsuensis]|uniref:L-fuculose-phosphate aldolase n=1 Tax=Amycolatopsis jiangsuensis TaxID=1181879 RepID=A0A840IY03_9PSEU|nr:class II aldolase/adducin family protein [Amycolatopsis jiangsuensis]MBB4685754.1 L-fuculose-phosphate aldolase [Amycolatopsis jiangsuensis]
MIDALVAAGRRLADAGISPGSSGNLSVRDGEHILVTGTGADLGRLGEDSVAVLDAEGAHVGGPRPSKEVAVHLAMYARNRDHTAVVHVHSPHAVAVACLPPWSETSAVPPLTPYFLMRVGQAPLIAYRAPGDPGLGALLAAPPFSFRAALLANHGQVTSGADLGDALTAAVELEETCRIVLLTDGRRPRLLDAGAIGDLTRRNGTAWDAR